MPLEVAPERIPLSDPDFHPLDCQHPAVLRAERTDVPEYEPLGPDQSVFARRRRLCDVTPDCAPVEKHCHQDLQPACHSDAVAPARDLGLSPAARERHLGTLKKEDKPFAVCDADCPLFRLVRQG